MDIAKRAEELRTLLNHHSDLYYNQDASVISDAEYDALVAEFARKQPRFYDQWRASYIGPLPAHATPHPFRMLSLRGNTFDAFAEFAEWLTNMPKKQNGKRNGLSIFRSKCKTRAAFCWVTLVVN